MARGATSKQFVFNKILEAFPGSFMQDDKILRIPCEEDGAIVEIKVSLTAAKDVLGKTAPTTESYDWEDTSATPTVDPNALQPSEEEKARIAKMMAALGM